MKNKKGFTLIELLVVVLIIGIIAAIALPLYRKAVERSKVAEAISNLKAMENATNMYILEHDFPKENVLFKDYTNVELDGGVWGEDNKYTTQHFNYFAYCGSSCFIRIYRNTEDYVLVSQIRLANNKLETVHSCYTQNTNMGRYICEFVEPNNWTKYDEAYS